MNDGVCDYDICCDGSDEAGLSNSNPTAPKCENKCKEIHARYVAEKKKQSAIVEAGLKMRDQLVVKAKKQKQSLETDLQKAQEKVAQLEQQIAQNEAKLQLLSQTAGGETQDNTVPQELLTAKDTIQDLEKKYSSALDIIAKFQSEIASYESILATMKTEYNPNFNDPAVKAAIRSFEEMQANSDGSVAEQITQIHESKNTFSTVVSGLANYQPPRLAAAVPASLLPDFVQDKLTSLKYWLIENGILADSTFDPMGVTTSSSGSSPEITLLQNLINKHNTELTRLKSDIEGFKTDLASHDYGHDEVLRSLKNTCVSNHIGEYTYEFCFGGQASQKGNGQSTTLGKFSSLHYSEDGKSLTLNYEKGAKCWSGPIRRASVQLVCGAENQILQVSEPERCEYFFKVSSPIACSKLDVVDTGAAGVRDEL